jgi:hypothetical protein
MATMCLIVGFALMKPSFLHLLLHHQGLTLMDLKIPRILLLKPALPILLLLLKSYSFLNPGFLTLELLITLLLMVVI